MDTVDLEEELSQEIGLVAPAYCLYINGERLAATPHEGALEELLSQLQDAATDENTLSCSFAEDVEIKYEYAPTSEIMNLGYLAEMLYSTKTAEVTYEVKAGDTWSEIYAGWMRGYGYLVEIRHGNGYTTRYGHNSSLTVSVGDHVYQGQQIARIGSTGNSTGNHCHFEVRVNGTPHNPMNYLR